MGNIGDIINGNFFLNISAQFLYQFFIKVSSVYLLLQNNNSFYKNCHTLEQSRNVTGYDYFELKKGIEIAVNEKGEITRFIITDSNLETVKGIKIGDNKEEVIKAYGKNIIFARNKEQILSAM